MSLRRSRIENADTFFASNGSGWMKLNKEAAQEVLVRLRKERKRVSMIEAGIWHNPGFEARLDGILSEDTKERDGIDVDTTEEFFVELDPTYDTFIVTVQKSRDSG